ncbi:MAG: hypothetical protein ACE5JJ_09260 [Nitrospinota bacterium]
MKGFLSKDDGGRKGWRRLLALALLGVFLLVASGCQSARGGSRPTMPPEPPSRGGSGY